MNIDDYLNDLQSSLNDHFLEFGISNNNILNSNNSDYIFCPECGTRVNADANFCPNCGEPFGNSNKEDCQEEFSNSNEGILFTNTSILAQKYKTKQINIIKLLNSFISKNEEMGVKWYLLDVADHERELGEGTWMDYSEIVQNFCKKNNIATGPSLSLFIIGGNDVIPQPCEENPSYSPSPWGGDEYQERVYADFYYSFYGRLKLDYLDYNKARCNVSRLPLESGTMKSTIKDDLDAYFNLSNTITKSGGISIGQAVMTSNVDWIPASREMSRNLPTESMKDKEDVVLDNMYISPSIMAEMDEKLSNSYYNSLSGADMLVFNLHGACEPKMSGFYSSGLAFSIDMLHKSNARIFNTVACWGGRYIKYTREQSMLLNALYGGGVLLYCGASVPALGKCGNYQQDSTWRIQPAAYSETFMARFAEYQCLGTMTAGEALLKAKCDYYNSSRMIEEDEYTLATVLMFNLYGNPKLRTTPNIEALSHIQHEDGSKEYRIPFRKMKRENAAIESTKVQANGSILDAVRSAVDNNLKLIHDGIVKNLYKTLGVEPRELFRVERYQTTDANGLPCNGYLYNYAREKENIRSIIRVNLDEQGNLLSAIQTK